MLLCARVRRAKDAQSHACGYGMFCYVALIAVALFCRQQTFCQCQHGSSSHAQPAYAKRNMREEHAIYMPLKSARARRAGRQIRRQPMHVTCHAAPRHHMLYHAAPAIPMLLVVKKYAQCAAAHHAAIPRVVMARVCCSETPPRARRKSRTHAGATAAASCHARCYMMLSRHIRHMTREYIRFIHYITPATAYAERARPPAHAEQVILSAPIRRIIVHKRARRHTRMARRQRYAAMSRYAPMRARSLLRVIFLRAAMLPVHNAFILAQPRAPARAVARRARMAEIAKKKTEYIWHVEGAARAPQPRRGCRATRKLMAQRASARTHRCARCGTPPGVRIKSVIIRYVFRYSSPLRHIVCRAHCLLPPQRARCR